MPARYDWLFFYEKEMDGSFFWHLLRYLRAVPTIRVHPELDGSTLDIVHSLITISSIVIGLKNSTPIFH